ncbi:RING-finger-containing ubiquitin ligase [Pyrenophora tritici-repentis]|uniref:RING-type E3 ubiquitin transferase n=2 Tax=Pyrenophora tritici-repentis TaxID=45151 RepID=A0A2W1D8C8_9PLEO|nr:zinc finger protein 364 [Pyrenophora tritici-repentis Pt-1C-BFP]KAA8611847.1 zinc finger protein [Pyrenophora tritici-repentis]EDU47923.1 zinc finger protein 364 [Pyrenophora tritici-repentis Pt-1C-BFP]KAF7447247.1 zinc finger protein [Pyrenophora tritici-repentis]KAF7569607.1 RING-finger-containing ubiquitin ligase [Pyrenophora tritici-repentis]KAG9382655.1 zinc finger protein 364 [Pyrenophora tritici-repentis]
MDQSSNQDAPSQNQRSGHRDMMFCHECNDEWYRDEHGLSCPECGSDFTEIIEDNNDPRDTTMFGHDGDDTNSLPDLEDALPHLHQHNPWQNDDPEEGDISNIHFTQTAPGRYNLQATVTRSVSPQGGLAPGSIGGFMAMLNGLTGAALRPQGQAGQTEGPFSRSPPGTGENPNQTAFQEAQNQGAQGGPQIHGGRFTYRGGARIFPRDGNAAGRAEPVDEMTNIVTGLMAAFGAPPGHIHVYPHPQGGAQGMFGGEHNHVPGEQFAGNPILQLFSTMGIMGPAGNNLGDFVYSQEGLDRIVSQLMEQTATSNAPGPATQNDIDALPRKEVTEDMLGDEHKAECSICMDEVNIGEQVTLLPCKHWFHHPCISAWLREHDTCPHCRKGITKGGEGQSNNPASAEPQADRTSHMPGSFNPDSPPDNQGNSSGNANAESGNDGISDRIRRGLFGSPQ